MGDRAEDAVTLLLCAAAILLAAFLRFHQLGVPCYWLDEVLGDNLTTSAAHAPWWRWIVAVAALIAKKIDHERRTSSSASVMFGVAAVTAMSPLHVYFSREARPYGLVLLFSTIALLLLCGAGNLAGEVLTVLALLYTSAVAGPVVAAVFVTALIARRWRFAAISGAALALFPLLYRGTRIPSDVPIRKLDFSLLADISRAFAVSALDSPVRPATFTAIAVFAVIGVVAIARRNRRTAAIVVAMTILPPLFAVTALQLFGHWFAIRYVLAGLPAFLVLVGSGIAALTSLAGVAELAFTIVITGALAFELVPIARREPALKVDWRSLAAALKAHARPGDIIIAGQMWSGVSMAYYLHDLPPDVRFMGLFDVKGASSELAKRKAGWLISSGPGNPVRDWMCRYPVVASSELEDLRVEFAPSVSDFVQRHSNAEEMRAAAYTATDDVLLDAGGRNDLLLGGKWGTGEGARDTAGQARQGAGEALGGLAGRAAFVVGVGEEGGAGGAGALVGAVAGGPAGEDEDQQQRTQDPAGVGAFGGRRGLVGLPEDVRGEKMPQDADEVGGRPQGAASRPLERHKPFLCVGLCEDKPMLQRDGFFAHLADKLL